MSRPNAEWFVGVLLVVTGISHVLRPREWAGLFISLLRESWGGLVIGMPTVAMGLLVVLSHNVWVWAPGLIVTVIGWGWIIKGTLYLLWPALPRRVATPHLARPERFRWAGAVCVLLGAVVLAGALRS
jgi:uncharacterized protein YjeT (DUF2065 family)